jgi:predicted amidohydrolase YtcJ
MAGSVLWQNGRIFTGRRYVEAVVAENGRTVAAGTLRAVRRLRATGTERIDLHGRLVVPGLVDAHLHLSETARAMLGVDLRGTDSIGEVGRRVRRWARLHPDGPVVGGGWEEARFAERRYPTSRELAQWVGDRPVALFRVCHHAAIVSPGVLDSIGVRSDSDDPPGGRIGREKDGSPNGALFDRALVPLRNWVDRTFSTRPGAIADVLGRAAGFGLTTVGAVSAAPGEVETTVALARRGSTPTRVVFYLRAEHRKRFAALRRSSRTSSTDVVGVKVLADGAFGPRTAWLERPYHDRPGERGFPLQTSAELRTVMAESDAAGAALAIHAIGDRAIGAALDAIESVRPARTPRIEHASLTPPALLGRLRKIRPLLVVQPGFVRSDSWIVERLGRTRARWTYPFASLLRDGHAPAGSSDSPVELLDPWLGIAAASEVRTGTGAPERIGVESALRLYTSHGGAALGHPAVGSLEPGAVADLVVSRATTLRTAVGLGSGHIDRVYRDGALLRTRTGPRER